MSSLLPHDLAAEKSVIGAVLIDANAIERARSIIGPLDFFRVPHQQIFRAQLDVFARGEPIDALTVKAELERQNHLEDVGGYAYVTSLTDGVPRSANIEYYARIVRDRARERKRLDRLEIARVQFVAGRPEAGLVEIRALLETDAVDEDELILEPVAAVAHRLSLAPPSFLVPGLVPRDGITLAFGDPRTFKSLTVRALAVAIARGNTAALELPRLRTGDPEAVVYVTEEDAPASVLAHFEAFSDGAAGRGELPLYLSACRGLSLDDIATQDRIVRQVAMCGAAVVIFEPIRSLTVTVDQGPRELQPLTRFIRRLRRETGAAVVIGHHAVKRAAGADTRTGAHRVSGGGLWSISDAPIAFERDGDRVIVTPTSWKACADPAPLSLRLQVTAGQVRRVMAEEHAIPAPSEVSATIEARVLAALVRPLHTRGVLKDVRGVRAADVLAALDVLAAEGRVRRVRQGRLIIWTAVDQGTAE